MIKKFTTFLLAFAIVLSISTPRSSAAGGAIGTVVGSVAKYTFGAVTTELILRAAQNGLETYFSKPQTKAFVENLIAEGIFSLTDYFAAGYTDQDIYDQFTNYNAQLETDLGTTTLIDGGVRVLLPVYVYSRSNSYLLYTDEVVGSGYYSTVITTSAYSSPSASAVTTYIGRQDFVVPFDCTLRTDYSFDWKYLGEGTRNLTSSYHGGIEAVYEAGDVLSGTINVMEFAGPTSGKGLSFSVVFKYWADLFPVSGSLPISLDITSISRPTTLTTPVAVRNDDDTYTVYNNIALVDEGNKVVFDPTTGEFTSFTDWAYDYDSRTYDLTLDGGGDMTVQFGDDSITMTKGDTVTNIFYVQDPADDPGTDPDNPGTDDESGWAWWKEAWTAFTQKFFTIFGGDDIQNILPGEEGDPDDEEDDGWTVLDLFALIRDALWRIITGVLHTALDGFFGLVQAIASLGDFFTVFDRDTEGGVLDILNQGGSAVWE